MPPRMIQDYITDLTQQVEAVTWQPTWCNCTRHPPRTTAPSIDGRSQVQVCYLPDGGVVFAIEVNGLTAVVKEDVVSGIAWFECNIGTVGATWMGRGSPRWSPTAKVTGEAIARHVVECARYLVDRGATKPKKD